MEWEVQDKIISGGETILWRRIKNDKFKSFCSSFKNYMVTKDFSERKQMAVFDKKKDVDTEKMFSVVLNI